MNEIEARIIAYDRLWQGHPQASGTALAERIRAAEPLANWLLGGVLPRDDAAAPLIEREQLGGVVDQSLTEPALQDELREGQNDGSFAVSPDLDVFEHSGSSMGVGASMEARSGRVGNDPAGADDVRARRDLLHVAISALCAVLFPRDARHISGPFWETPNAFVTLVPGVSPGTGTVSVQVRP